MFINTEATLSTKLALRRRSSPKARSMLCSSVLWLPSATIFISLSFWEMLLSCPNYLPSRSTFFDLALDKNPGYPVCCRLPYVLFLWWVGSPKNHLHLGFLSYLVFHACVVCPATWARVSATTSQSPVNGISSEALTSLIHSSRLAMPSTLQRHYPKFLSIGFITAKKTLN